MDGTAENSFDAHAREAQLRSEAQAWDTSVAHDAHPGDIPSIDLSGYFGGHGVDALEAAASTALID